MFTRSLSMLTLRVNMAPGNLALLKTVLSEFPLRTVEVDFQDGKKGIEEPRMNLYSRLLASIRG